MSIIVATGIQIFFVFAAGRRAVENLLAFYVRINDVHPAQVACDGAAITGAGIGVVISAPVGVAITVEPGGRRDFVVVLRILQQSQPDLLEIALATGASSVFSGSGENR